jgi:choline monooxygenase
VGELVTCPLHRWTYQPLTGSLEETPSYARLPRSCPRQLESVDLAEIGKSGFYFEHKPNYLEAYFLYLTQLRISTRDFEFDSEQVTFYHVSWETIADCYLDKHRHKFEKYGFSQYVNPEAATTYGGQSYLITEYPLRPAGTDLSGTIGWSKLHEEVMKLNWQPTWGSLHTLIFPGLMIEFYPHVMVINQIVPQSDKLTAVYHQVYFERSALENYDLQNAFSEAYSEKAQNDSVVYDLYEDGRLNSRFFIPPTRNEDRHLGAVEGLHDWLGHDYKKS